MSLYIINRVIVLALQFTCYIHSFKHLSTSSVPSALLGVGGYLECDGPNLYSQEADNLDGQDI